MKTKPLPEIAGKGTLYAGHRAYWIIGKYGWRGPIRRTPRGAILAWNRVMEGHEKLKTLRTSLCDRVLKELRWINEKDEYRNHQLFRSLVIELVNIRRGK